MAKTANETYVQKPLESHSTTISPEAAHTNRTAINNQCITLSPCPGSSTNCLKTNSILTTKLAAAETRIKSLEASLDTKQRVDIQALWTKFLTIEIEVM